MGGRSPRHGGRSRGGTVAMVIVDTTVWIEYLQGVRNRRTDWLDGELGRRRLALTDLILCEVLQGVQEDRRLAEVERDLRRFKIFVVGGIGLAVAAAQNYRTLRQAGWTIRTVVDCLIATFCLSNGHRLLHNDPNFDPFESVLGLQVVHP
jgi:predicted nucleic acid-binding protein